MSDSERRWEALIVQESHIAWRVMVPDSDLVYRDGLELDKAVQERASQLVMLGRAERIGLHHEPPLPLTWGPPGRADTVEAFEAVRDRLSHPDPLHDETRTPARPPHAKLGLNPDRFRSQFSNPVTGVVDEQLWALGRDAVHSAEITLRSVVNVDLLDALLLANVGPERAAGILDALYPPRLPTLVIDDNGTNRLRCPHCGTLDAISARYGKANLDEVIEVKAHDDHLHLLMDGDTDDTYDHDGWVCTACRLDVLMPAKAEAHE